MKQEDLDKWNIKHINMGRPAKYAKTDHAKIEQCLNKTVFKLKPIAIPLSQKVSVDEKAINSLDKRVTDKLLNTTIKGEKMKNKIKSLLFLRWVVSTLWFIYWLLVELENLVFSNIAKIKKRIV